jgi:two-component system, cell cycle response regulator DivK
MTKILLVEDNELSADMLLRRLKKRGYDVHLATDGQQAVDMAVALLPELVLMDISLPLIDGFEATRRIRQNPSTAVVPIIALTAHALPVERARALEAGCDDYDIKPVELERLLGKITAVLGKKNA